MNGPVLQRMNSSLLSLVSGERSKDQQLGIGLQASRPKFCDSMKIIVNCLNHVEIRKPTQLRVASPTQSITTYCRSMFQMKSTKSLSLADMSMSLNADSYL